jgi:predicted XRE-type DNA-binding protein
MKEKIFISTDNVFSDLGLEDSDEMKTRSDLMSEVVSIIRNSGVPQKEFAVILGISVPKVSALMSGKINDFSNDTLMNYLTLLGCNVEIKVLHQFLVSNSTKKGIMKVKRDIPRKKMVNIRKRKTRSKII